MKVTVHRQKCIGAANCTGLAPKSFALDGERKVVLLDPTAQSDASLFEAAESCPVEAVHLFDEEGGQLYP